MQIIPSFLVDKASCTRQFESELSLHSLASLFPIKEGIFSNPSVSLSKGSSTSNQAFSIVFTTPSVPLVGDRNLRRKDVNRPTRCSEPLRSKVGGPSKVFAMFCGMGPLGADIYIMSTFIEIAFNFLQISNSIFMYYRITTYIYKFRIAKTYIWFLYHCCSFIKQTHIFFYI